MAPQPDLVIDPCFLALTRPATYFGVTLEAFVFNMTISTILFVNTKIFWFLGVGLIMHFVFRGILWYDVNMFRVLVVWVQTSAQNSNRAYWGGSTITPIPVLRRKGA